VARREKAARLAAEEAKKPPPKEVCTHDLPQLLVCLT
jgi:hypothetical protein